MTLVLKHQKGRKMITDKDRTDICALYAQNKSITKISQELGITRHFINKTLKEENISIVNNRSKKMDVNESEICSLYQKGDSIIKLAKQFNTSSPVIKRALKDNKVPLRGRGRQLGMCVKIDEEKAIKMYENHVSVREIGKVFGVSHQAVYEMLARRKLPSYKSAFRQENEKQIINLYTKEKVTINRIARTYGVSSTCIRRILTANNIEIEANRSRLYSKSEIEDMAEMYRNGDTLEAIGKIYGGSYITISRVLKEQGVAVSRTKVTGELKAKILRAYIQGVPIKTITEKFGICYGTLNELLHKEKVPLRLPRNKSKTTKEFNSALA